MACNLARLILLLALVVAGPARADAPDATSVSLAKSFAKICILALSNLEGVTLTARIEGWQQVEGPAHDTLFLSTSPPTQTSWATSGVDGLPVIVTIARKGSGVVKSMHITCAVQNPDASGDAVATALTSLLTMPPPEPVVSEGDKRITLWHLHYGASGEVGIGLVVDAAKKTGAILSAVHLQNTP